MFVEQLPGQTENCECQGRLRVWCPADTFGHMNLEAIPALPVEGYSLPSVFLASWALFKFANPLERECSHYLLDASVSPSHAFLAFLLRQIKASPSFFLWEESVNKSFPPCYMY